MSWCHCHQSKGREWDCLYLGSVWGPCHHLLWCPSPSGSHLRARHISVLFIFTADHSLCIYSGFNSAACFNWWGCSIIVLNSRQMVLEQGPHAESTEMVLASPTKQGPVWIPVGGSQPRVRDALLSCLKHHVRRGKGKGPCWIQGIASPLQLTHLCFPHGMEFFVEEQWRVCQVQSLPGSSSITLMESLSFLLEGGAARALQCYGWSGLFPLQAEQGERAMPGKGFLTR